jgi:hypothetical protein
VYTQAQSDATFLTKSNPSYTGTLTGGTGVVNIGSGQLYKDASGNVGIGTSSPTARIDMFGNYQTFRNGTYTGYVGKGDNIISGAAPSDFGVSTPSNLVFGTGSSLTERMRIDSGGNLLVGGTSAAGKIAVTSPVGANFVGHFANLTTSGNVYCLRTSLESNGNNTSSHHMLSVTQNVAIWYLYGNGTMSWSSDERLKKNIETTRNGYIDDLCKLRVVKYNWHNQEEGTPKELGLIAQEVEQVFPNLIQEVKEDIELNGIKNTKVIKGSVLPFMLLKAIQEQQVLIQSQADTITAMEARLTALESK